MRDHVARTDRIDQGPAAYYRTILCAIRRQASRVQRPLASEFFSDRSRVIFCASFRRLQQKAQVFALEPNSHVRTRLIHSLEVSDIGRSVAGEIVQKLAARNLLQADLVLPFVTVVETACLLHDIGNPPFGHFGEEAIRKWFAKSWWAAYRRSLAIHGTKEPPAPARRQARDLLEFDGNPQGVRIVLRLHCERDEFSLNLTLPTILAGLKYVGCTDDPRDGGLQKKPGFFQSERQVVHELLDLMRTKSGVDFHGKRYPLTYIVEAADDIAYCMSDIADGLTKKLFTPATFYDFITDHWKASGHGKGFLVRLPDKRQSVSVQFNAALARALISRLASVYCARHNDVIESKLTSLVDADPLAKAALTAMKDFARAHLYRSREAENMELAGFSIITGLLDLYRPLLDLERPKFACLVKSMDDSRCAQAQGIDHEWRLFNSLGVLGRKAYHNQVPEGGGVSDEQEWFIRAHLIIDHVSAMTDDYALESFQRYRGIRM